MSLGRSVTYWGKKKLASIRNFKNNKTQKNTAKLKNSAALGLFALKQYHKLISGRVHTKACWFLLEFHKINKNKTGV